MPDSNTRTYAIRRLSPFQGFTQIIEAGDGMASSQNGLDWRIQIHIEQSPNPHDNADETWPEHSLILFGFWSSEGGFHRVPLPPMIESRQIEAAAQPILDELLATTRSAPFSHIDCYELWLLDKDDMQPLALINSACDLNELPVIEHPKWQSTQLTDHSFSRSWSSHKSNSTNEPRDILNTLINKTAGSHPAAQWFIRHEDGSGTGIDGINISDKLKTRSLRSEDFPELLLKGIWPDEEAQQLVDNYFDWLSPFLLTLPDLRANTRQRLEQSAFKQPFKVEGQYNLWPEIIDKEKLKAVLIEAKMRRSNPTAGEH